MITMAGHLFLKGVILGFSIAAPVGPIGVLCIRRTLDGGLASGLATGLGTAVADSLYGLLAALGVTALATFLVEHQLSFRLIGGAFLCYLGLATLRAVPAAGAATAAGRGLFGAFASSFALTLANPLTILSFAAVFAGLGLGESGSGGGAVALVSGVFTGSLGWWLILSFAVSRLRSRFDHCRLIWVNRFSGLVILGFGLLCFRSLV